MMVFTLRWVIYGRGSSLLPRLGVAGVGASGCDFTKALEVFRKRITAESPLRVLRRSAVERVGLASCSMCLEASCSSHSVRMCSRVCSASPHGQAGDSEGMKRA
jgi:hypothetical protein